MLTFWQDYPEIQEQLEKVQQLMAQRLKINHSGIQAALQKFAAQGGKMVRPAFFFLFAGLILPEKEQLTQEKMIKVAASLEMLHSATLIHDDIIDDSPLRRGLPSIESQFGKDIAVYTGDFIYTIYFELLIETMNGTPFLARNAASMKKILQGELGQMQAAFAFDHSVKKYLQVISGKTAELLSLSCLEGIYFAGGNQKMQQSAKKIGRAIGLAFQIYDDVLNFTIGQSAADKPILTDVRQGIYTLPLLIARENAPEKILPFLKEPEFLTQEKCLELADLVVENDGITGAMGLAQNLTNIALKEIETFPASSSQEILISATQKLLKRKY